MEDDKFIEKIKKLEEILDEKREFYNTEINKLIISSGDFDKISDVQINMLSLRHKLLEYLTTDLNKALIQAKTYFEKGKKNSLVQIKTNYNLKLTSDKEKSIIVEADTRLFKEMIEHIESQQYYIKESIRLLDNLAYAIKNKIEVYKFQFGE